MNLIPWKRRRPDGQIEQVETLLRRFRDEFNQLFERFWRDPWGFDLWSQLSPHLPWGPALDVAETDDEIVIKVELPGVDPADLDVSVCGDMLTIRGEKRQEQEQPGRSFHRIERRFGAFRRSTRLPTVVDTDRVEAQYKDGLLTIRLPKKAGARPRRIPVRAE
ncbi:MAG: Hsp20/alpha crystallin family protein [Phycisphaerae bacterium]